MITYVMFFTYNNHFTLFFKNENRELVGLKGHTACSTVGLWLQLIYLNSLFLDDFPEDLINFSLHCNPHKPTLCWFPYCSRHWDSENKIALKWIVFFTLNVTLERLNLPLMTEEKTCREQFIHLRVMQCDPSKD